MNPLLSTALVIVGIIAAAVFPPLGVALIILAVISRRRFNRRVRFYQDIYAAQRYQRERDAYVDDCRRLP